MSGFGVTPPWYGDDEIAFNAYAIASEKRRDALRRLGFNRTSATGMFRMPFAVRSSAAPLTI